MLDARDAHYGHHLRGFGSCSLLERLTVEGTLLAKNILCGFKGTGSVLRLCGQGGTWERGAAYAAGLAVGFGLFRGQTRRQLAGKVCDRPFLDVDSRRQAAAVEEDGTRLFEGSAASANGALVPPSLLLAC